MWQTGRANTLPHRPLLAVVELRASGSDTCHVTCVEPTKHEDEDPGQEVQQR